MLNGIKNSGTKAATGSSRVISVNVGRPQTVQAGRLEVTSAIWKNPVSGPVALGQLNFEGDEQADLQAHGGPDKAVYAYASEDLDWWAGELGRAVSAGAVGENLTTAGIDFREALIGERWQIGSAILEVAQPRIPCYKLGVRFEDAAMPKRFAAALRPGAYLRVITAGAIEPGDAITVVSRPAHAVTIDLLNRVYHVDHKLAVSVLAAPALPAGWRTWVQEMVQKLQ